MGFLVSVRGGRAPEHVHESVDNAINEALRLQGALATERGWSPDIRILQEVMTLPFRAKGAALDYSAIRIQEYSCKVSVGTVMNLVRHCNTPL